MMKLVKTAGEHVSTEVHRFGHIITLGSIVIERGGFRDTIGSSATALLILCVVAFVIPPKE